MTTIKKIEDELVSYKRFLEDAYLDDAWQYFEHEKLKLHPTWNGYKCAKCGSMNAVKNKDGWCIKCLVLREKIDVIDKIINNLKGGTPIWKDKQKLTSQH